MKFKQLYVKIEDSKGDEFMVPVPVPRGLRVYVERKKGKEYALVIETLQEVGESENADVPHSRGAGGAGQAEIFPQGQLYGGIRQ